VSSAAPRRRHRRYQRNIVNTRILTPGDVNYSDDELTFLPYFTWLLLCGRAGDSTLLPTTLLALQSLQRSFRDVAALRSDLWCAAAPVLLSGSVHRALRLMRLGCSSCVPRAGTRWPSLRPLHGKWTIS
jgi:hypothetical protein